MSAMPNTQEQTPDDFTDETPTTIRETPELEPAPVPFEPLTVREREVATLLCRGVKHQEIAKAMGISSKTVDTHRGHIMDKLKVKNNVELLRLAIVRGWVAVEYARTDEGNVLAQPQGVAS